MNTRCSKRKYRAEKGERKTDLNCMKEFLHYYFPAFEHNLFEIG